MQKITLTEEQKSIVKKMKTAVSDSSYPVVSFKFTDILAVSPFSEFGDMFSLMESDFSAVCTGKKTFSQLRETAQNQAERNSYGTVTIDDIYRAFAKISRIPQDAVNSLMKRERELFVEYTFARDFGKTLYDEAFRAKKKIIVVADTIYHTKDVEKVLKKCDIKYKAIVHPAEMEIPSSDYEAVFDAVTEKSGVTADKILHIGGNVAADVETPILKGAKALLLSPPVPLMVKSGQLRGWIQAELVYDYDSPEYMALHAAFGLYAAYCFDIPANKMPKSDFCGDAFRIGFIVLGALSLAENFTPKDEIQKNVLEALRGNLNCTGGREYFRELYERHFGEVSQNFGKKGCELPFEFLCRHASQGDIEIFSTSHANPENWKNYRKDPVTAAVYGRKMKQNAVSKLADKMFPKGTKVRNIADGMLVKMKSNMKK